MKRYYFIPMILIIALPFLTVTGQKDHARNPVIWADVPDMSIVRIGSIWYMSSTTMHSRSARWK